MVRIVIVGAGLAGLAAATALCSADVFQVTILEASKQVGGRTHSTRLGTHAMDLGATSVYYNRQSGDSLVEYAIAKGLVERTTEIENYDKFVHDKPTLHLLSNGERLPSERVQLYQQAYYKAIDKLTMTHDEEKGTEWTAFNTDGLSFNAAVAHHFFSIIQSEGQERGSNPSSPSGTANPKSWAAHHILDHMLVMEGILTYT